MNEQYITIDEYNQIADMLPKATRYTLGQEKGFTFADFDPPNLTPCTGKPKNWDIATRRVYFQCANTPKGYAWIFKGILVITNED